MTNAPYPVPDDDATPFPVDFDRLMRGVAAMGHKADPLVAGRAAGALFDGVPFLFTFDSQGRFLSVRAVWETGLDPQVAVHDIFAAADGWNREKYFPTVYWMVSEAGTVQVCADFAIDTRAGLTDEQLAENLGAGISTGITAIEYMRQAASQTLGWREPPAPRDDVGSAASAGA